MYKILCLQTLKKRISREKPGAGPSSLGMNPPPQAAEASLRGLTPLSRGPAVPRTRWLARHLAGTRSVHEGNKPTRDVGTRSWVMGVCEVSPSH